MFKNVQDPRLTGLIVWVPMVPGDDALAAGDLISPDKRLTVQAWDGSRKLGDTFAKTLHLKCTAWDVYMVYKPGVRWNEELPPEPTFWMHQLSRGADPKLHLNPEKLQAEIQSLLNEVPPTTEALPGTKLPPAKELSLTKDNAVPAANAPTSSSNTSGSSAHLSR